MNLIDLLARKVIDFYASSDATQIAHTQCVASYTHQIASAEGWPAREAMLLECAAWLHDIGCPAAVEKYGNSKPEYQMSEGRRITPTLLKDFDELTPQEKQWITDVVGTQDRKSTRLNSSHQIIS